MNNLVPIKKIDYRKTIIVTFWETLADRSALANYLVINW